MHAHPQHPTALRPWRPLSDDEYAAIRPYLPPEEGRGRPSDRRRTLDAIFWIAASKEPWRALPSQMGRGESVARTLRRWARAGWLDRLLVAVSAHPLASDDPALRRLAWLICRAFRRMARVLDEASLRLAERLGLRTAWPAPVLRWPNEGLFRAASALCHAAARRFDADPWNRPLLRATLDAYRDCLRLMRLARGNRAAWRLR